MRMSQTDALYFIEQTIQQLKIDRSVNLNENLQQFIRKILRMFLCLKKSLKLIKRYGLKGNLVDELDLPFAIEKALILEDQAQFHPLKYTLGSCLNSIAEASNNRSL